MSKAKKFAALAEIAKINKGEFNQYNKVKSYLKAKKAEPPPIKFGKPVDELATLPVPEINPKDLDVAGEWNGGTAKYIIGNLPFSLRGAQQTRLAYQFVDRWFYDGLDPELIVILRPKKNVVAINALNVLKLSLNSTVIEHSAKMSAVAYMLSSWFYIEEFV